MVDECAINMKVEVDDEGAVHLLWFDVDVE